MGDIAIQLVGLHNSVGRYQSAEHSRTLRRDGGGEHKDGEPRYFPKRWRSSCISRLETSGHIPRAHSRLVSDVATESSRA